MTELLGRWHQDRGLGDTVSSQSKPYVTRCMRCQIQAERQKGDDAALDRVVNVVMVQRVIVWLAKKGLVWE